MTLQSWYPYPDHPLPSVIFDTQKLLWSGKPRECASWGEWFPALHHTKDATPSAVIFDTHLKRKSKFDYWGENSGEKPLVWENGVEIGEKHGLQLDHCESGNYIP